MADIKIASDSGKLYAGVDADLEIYSNGSHSYIANATAAHSIVLRTRASGGATADAVTIDADKNVTMTGTLGVTGAVTANAGVVNRTRKASTNKLLFIYLTPTSYRSIIIC